MNRQALSDLIARGEGFTSEFKRSMPSDLGREICAFANASGGVILLGVTDKGDIVGVADHSKLRSQVQSIARSAEPLIKLEVASIASVLCVTVPVQHNKPYSFGGKFFMREGANSQQLSREEIRELFYAEGLIYFRRNPLPGVFVGRRFGRSWLGAFLSEGEDSGQHGYRNRPAQPAPDRRGWPYDPSRGVVAGP